MRALSEVTFIYYRISGLSQKLAFFSVRILKWIHSIICTTLNVHVEGVFKLGYIYIFYYSGQKKGNFMLPKLQLYFP